ncbi:hypothetical protein AMAG_01847 [Allomyces macrogynus ATCC 38327]|uniref:J domain-containing protein n=1 Tax=Allomyces macrogynus (strain ATCC 38327) TaxID=578462 RepID=A0A0L0S0C8_ALLM3|nr:hypothetical protein AMAG_01847 [Allomyces macrogynus ATCC 38327]|eukprot:KNE56003.1 hypothetical protein AMAG_01847 [Allomyces macrogynus ATCC 38327]
MDPNNFPNVARDLLFDDEAESEQVQQILQLPQDDFYAILNVPRDATPEQIKDSYKKLCMVFHPDKNPDPDAKEAAEKQFQKISRAFEVLSDPRKRTYLDLYGPDCPELKGLAVGPVLKTPDEIRADYENRIRRENLARLESLIKQRGEATVSLDASKLLFQVDDEPREMEVQSFNLRYATDMPIDETLVVGLSGKMLTRGKFGSGNLRAVVRKTFSRATKGEASIHLLSPHTSSVKVDHVLDDATDTSVSLELQSTRPLAMPPTITVGIQRRLLKNRPVLGFARLYSGHYRLGSWGTGDLATQISEMVQTNRRPVIDKSSATSFTTGLQWSTAQSLSYLALATSMFEQAVTVFHQHKVGKLTTVELVGALDARQGSFTASWKVMHRVADHTKLGVGVAVSSGGTVLNLAGDHLGQKLNVPVTVFPAPNAVMAIAASVIPLAVAGAASFRKKKWADESRKPEGAGLTVVQALYGKVKDLQARVGAGIPLAPSDDICVIDVTVPVMFLVDRSTLRVDAGTRFSELLGFYDPCPWEDKQLLVTYSFRGKFRQVVVNDQAGLVLPLRTHPILEPSQVGYSDKIKAVHEAVKARSSS